ncbi:MAG: DUF721 domain-containing protein [Candidatus Tumulicola sp.]
MLRRLTQALGEWTPQERSRRSRDPLLLLAAGWGNIVGEDVARNTHPARILEGTLLVTTRSSAWSQQLSFLAERIVAAVRARFPETAVVRLRFRVGKLPPPPAPLGKVVAPDTIASKRSAAPPARTTAEAVARFRQGIDERRRAKRSVGWKECQGCEALIAPRAGTLCVTCANARSQRRAAAVIRLLFEAPWLGYPGTAQLVDGLTPQDYESIRTRLLSRWWEALAQARACKRLSRDGRERLIASSYVVLKSKLPPEAIAPATLRNVLGDELCELIYGTEQQKKTNVE